MHDDNEPVALGSVESSDSHHRLNDAGLLHMHGDRPKFLGSSSSQVFMKWLQQERPDQHLAGHFGHAAADVEEVSFPGLGVAHVDLPPLHETSAFVSSYFDRVHPYHPVLDKRKFDHWLSASGRHYEPEGFERLVLYLVISIGADYSTGNRALSPTGGVFLKAAWQSLPFILGAVNRSSAQALVLLAIACRCVCSSESKNFSLADAVQ